MLPFEPGRRLAVWSSFEFDLCTLQLRRRGLRLRLEYKPAQLLARLLAEPGELVGRDELVKLLWTDEAHGEFDRRLNKAVHKIRSVLGDDPQNPRFIQTLSRAGYRFTADVQFVARNGASLAREARAEAPETVPSQQISAVHGQAPVRLTEAVASVPGETLRRPNRLAWVLAVAIILGAALFSVRTVYVKWHPSRSHRSIAILGFRNLSENPADEWLSAALTDWLASDLTADGELRAVPSSDVARFRSEAGSKAFDRISPDLFAKIYRDLGCGLVLSGSYASSGTGDQGRMRLDLRVYESPSGSLLFSLGLVGRRADVFDLAESAGIQLRSKLRLRPIAVAGLGAMRSMLPGNPDAARFYTEGTEDMARFDASGARRLLQTAVALEPEHAPTHAALSTADTMLGFSADARSEAEEAFEHTAGLGSAERLLIEGQFYEANYQWEKAASVYSRLVQLFPGSAGNGIRLARAQELMGKPQLALDTVTQLRQSPLGSIDRARVDLAEAEAAALISDFRRQRDAAARAADRARQSGAPLLLARSEEEEGRAVRALGNLRQALALWKDAETRYVAAGDRAAVAQLLTDEGQLRGQQGDPQGADASLSSAIVLSKQIGDEATLGRALTALAQVRMFSVGPAEGNRLCNEALEISRKTGNEREEAYTLSVLGDISFADHAQAIRLYRRSLELSRDVNDRSRTAGRLMDLGIVATVQGDLPGAESHLQQSLAIYHDIGERNREALQLNLLSIVRIWQGKTEEAERLSNQAVAMLSSIGDAVPLAQSRQNLGIAEMYEGRLAEAEATLKMALAEHQRADNPGGVAITSGQLAQVFLLEGKFAESEAALKVYDQTLRENSRGRPSAGEHVTDRMITAARILAAEGKAAQARNQAVLAVQEALKTDQGSMLMKARLALCEIELQGGHTASGRRELEALAREASAKGFGLISQDARGTLAFESAPRRILAHAPRRSVN